MHEGASNFGRPTDRDDNDPVLADGSAMLQRLIDFSVGIGDPEIDELLRVNHLGKLKVFIFSFDECRPVSRLRHELIQLTEDS